MTFFNSLLFLFFNIKHINKLPPIKHLRAGDIVYRGMHKFEFKMLKETLLLIDNSFGLGILKSLLCLLYGSKIVLIAENIKTKRFIGVELFYFNKRDRYENTIHEGYIGILPVYQNKGIASQLRQFAIKNFKRSKLSGISTRISLLNLPSIYSAKKVGFRIIERYKDIKTSKVRGYLVRYF